MAFYDQYAERERNDFGVKIKKCFANKIFTSALNEYANSPRILEIGPGDGYIADLAKAHNQLYIGIEANEKVCHKLISGGHNVIKAFVPPIPNNIGEFDICIILHVIEHLKSIQDAIELITQIKCILSKNGILIIATPDYLKWGKDFYNSDYTHSLPFTLKRIVQLLSSEGFQIVDAKTYVASSFGILKYPMYWLAKLFYLRNIDNALKNSLKSDIWYRAFLTFLPNIFVVAKK